MPSESITHKHMTGYPLALCANSLSEEKQLNIGAKSGSLIFFCPCFFTNIAYPTNALVWGEKSEFVWECSEELIILWSTLKLLKKHYACFKA